MAAYRRVYDSYYLQADCQEPGSAPEPYRLGNRVWATCTMQVHFDHSYSELYMLACLRPPAVC